MILNDYVRVLRRGWWAILALTIIGAVAGATYAYVSPKTYSARATVNVAVVGDASPTDLQQGNVFAVQRASTYADLATTSSVLTTAAKSLKDSNLTELRKSVTASARPETTLIDIDSSGSRPVPVADQANAVANALMSEASRLDASATAPQVRLSVVDPAEVPRVAATPRPRNDVLIAALIGLAIGVGVVVVAQALDTRVRTAWDLHSAGEITPVVAIPAGRSVSTRGAVSDRRLESFRQLRATLQFGAGQQRKIAVAGLTSALDSHQIAEQLAAVLGEIDLTVVVVDVDFRPPGGSRHGSGPDLSPDGAAAGIAEVLRGSTSLEETLIPGWAENVQTVGPGRADFATAQRLSTPVMGEVLEKLAARFDFVIIACPPLLERSESAVAAALADVTLLAVLAGTTKRPEVLRAVELLKGVNVDAVGAVIDGVAERDLDPANRTSSTSTAYPH